MADAEKNNAVLETRDLAKVYGDGEARVEALRGVSLRIEPGHMVAIMGPSGSGKSTLLALLGAVDNPSSGQVILEGKDLATLNDTERTLIRRRRLGFIFQAFNLLPTLTAAENVALPLELDGVSTREARDRAAAALDLVELGHRIDHLPGQMSGGEQQRVAIARALVIEPALVLADEPTGNLDSVNSGRVTQLLRRLVDKQGQTVVMVTHDPNVADAADQLIRLRDGRIEEQVAQRVVSHAGNSSPTSNSAQVGKPPQPGKSSQPHKPHHQRTKTKAKKKRR
jgi:putative ABC transport system ATP-binding protein